jgi:hypothetical protein
MTITCGNCGLFWPLQKGLKKGGTKALPHGYCLKHSIFPKNKPGKPVHPPRANIQDLPHNRAKTIMVHNDTDASHCTFFEEK